MAAGAGILLRFFRPRVYSRSGCRLSPGPGRPARTSARGLSRAPYVLIEGRLALGATVPRHRTRGKLNHLYDLASESLPMCLLVETETKVGGTDANATLTVQGRDFTGRRVCGVRDASRAIWESVFCSSLHVSLPCRPPPGCGGSGGGPGVAAGAGSGRTGAGWLCSRQPRGPLPHPCQGQAAWRAGQALWMCFEESPPRAPCGQGRGQLLGDPSGGRC